jgi:hypothetical protein
MRVSRVVLVRLVTRTSELAQRAIECPETGELADRLWKG